jgi:glycosyltransferase involved in cell wall biosynthesis
MEKQLHLVAFDVPFPPTYGGVIEVFYKLKALHEAGARVHLHCFEYGRGYAEQLEELCASVRYYPRKQSLQSLPVRYPHIVRSRRSRQLLQNLLQEPFPILFEGLHTTYYLSHPKLEDRRKLVRLHNIEWEYYYQLSQKERTYLKRQYMAAESRQLQAWERVLPFADLLLTISPKDTTYYQEQFRNVAYLPAFHANHTITSMPGQGEYCLYHAKLSVAENHEAAMFLIQEVFANLPVPLIVAGSEALPELIEELAKHDHIYLRHDPGEAEMEDLMRHAHIHVLPTFQATGIKLKLLNSLFNGRHVLVNPPMVLQTGLERYCEVGEDAADFQRLVLKLLDRPFPQKAIDARKALLQGTFSNAQNAVQLLEYLFPKDLVKMS